MHNSSLPPTLDSPTRGKGFDPKKLSDRTLSQTPNLSAAIAYGSLTKSDRIGSAMITASSGGSAERQASPADLAAEAKKIFSAKKGQVAASTSVSEVAESGNASGDEVKASDEIEEEIESELEEKEEEAEEAIADEKDPVAEPEPSTISINASQLDSLLTRVESMSVELTETRSQLASANTALAEANEETAASRGAVAVLNRLSTLTGTPVSTKSAEMPNIMRHTKPALSSPSGAYGDFKRAFENAPGSIVRTEKGGSVVVRDFREYEQILKANKPEVMAGLQAAMKAEGLLSGGNSSVAFGSGQGGNAINRASTTVADVASQFLPQLSSLVRLTNTTEFVWSNWVFHEYAYGQGAGHKMQFSKRGNLLPRPERVEDRILSGPNTFVPISTNTRPVRTGFIEATLEERGLGRATVGDPLGFTKFTERYSLLSLIQLINDSLYDDYLYLDDLDIRSKFKRTSKVAWNKKGDLTDTRTTLAAGDGGQLTVDFINAASIYLASLGVPKINGYYVMIVPTLALNGFSKDVNQKLELSNVASQKHCSRHYCNSCWRGRSSRY